MCGIAGIYRPLRDASDEATVWRMLGRLERRGPDDEGVAVEPCAVLGNRRLAILDLSPAGHQPMVSADGRYVVTFNGEIYNFRELANELGLAAGSLRSHSDTEVLLHAWTRWGAGTMERLVGQWAFALYDRRSHQLTLTRDRFGEKPLFFQATAARVIFASSLEALLEDRSIPRALDPAALAEYITLRYVVSPRTVLEGVHKLEGGHLLELTTDGSRSERAWYVHPFRGHAGPRPSRAKSAHGFGALLEQSVARCLVSDRPVGVLLSDGIDSNALLAALPECAQSATCFTFRLRGGVESDMPARMSMPGRTLVDVESSREELVEHLDEFCADLTEPVGDMAALATWMIIRSARTRATVFLCGHGGDEVLGGYRLSQDLFRLAMLRRLSALPSKWIAAAIRRHVNGGEELESLRRRLRDAAPAKVADAARFMIDRPLPFEQLFALFSGSLPKDYSYLGTIDRLYQGCPPDATVLDRIQQVLAQTFLSANILSWADSVSMSSSAELRMPYLDRDLVDYVAHLPTAHRVPHWPGRANTKRVLRDWARTRLPSEVMARTKKGFQTGSLEELLRAIPGSARKRVLGASALRRALPGLEAWIRDIPGDFTGGRSSVLWTLLVLAVWCEAHGID